MNSKERWCARPYGIQRAV